MSTKQIEISRTVRLVERCTTRYIQLIDPPTAILHSPVPVDGDDRHTNVFIGNPELQFMEIDQVGHPHRAGQLAIHGNSDLTTFSLEAVSAGTSLMDIDNSPNGDQVTLRPDQLAARCHRSATNIVPQGGMELHTFPDRFSASVAPRRRQRTVQESNLSDAIVPYPDVTLVNHGEDDSRETKRMRIMSEQENAVIENPARYEEVLESGDSAHWKSAIALEFQSLAEKQTWKIVNRPNDQTVIGCKWVFAVKRNEHGKIQRYKARVIAQGYIQTAGVDYTDTYAPVASTSSIRVLLSLCVQLGYKIHGMMWTRHFSMDI